MTLFTYQEKHREVEEVTTVLHPSSALDCSHEHAEDGLNARSQQRGQVAKLWAATTSPGGTETLGLVYTRDWCRETSSSPYLAILACSGQSTVLNKGKERSHDAPYYVDVKSVAAGLSHDFNLRDYI